MASLLNMSGSRLIGSKVLPYDAEIEYLQSTGTQYINTGIYSLAGSKIEADLQLVEYPPQGTGIWGTGGYSEGACMSFRFSRANGIVAYFPNETTSFGQYNASDRHHYVLDFPNRLCSVDDSVVSMTGYRISNRYSALFLLFRYSAAGESFGNRYCFIGKCFGAKYFLNGMILMDFIPVVKDNVGYMYDKVSGQLFGNAGKGAFILGADKTN